MPIVRTRHGVVYIAGQYRPDDQEDDGDFETEGRPLDRALRDEPEGPTGPTREENTWSDFAGIPGDD